jgi:hypothetical protein
MEDTIVVPIFSDEYKVVVTWGNWRKAARAHKHYVSREEDILANRFGVTLTTEFQHPMIVLPRFPTTPNEISVLAHEAVHAVECIFEYKDITPGGEFFADAVGAVVRIVLQNKPKKRK